MRPSGAGTTEQSGSMFLSQQSQDTVGQDAEAIAQVRADNALGHGGDDAAARPSINRRRQLGAYYTPDAIAEVLVRWALNEAPGSLLDPSFGGCAFLKAGAQVLRELGSPAPATLLFGVDIDESCIEYVRENSVLHEKNCIFQDFLSLAPADLPAAPFRAVVGNPPYVRHHWVKNDSWATARRVSEQSSIPVPQTASLWAYFVTHSLAFLQHGGRLAFLVPEAILQADYGTAIRNVLEANFRHVRLIHLQERLFSGTDEPVVIVAGEGFGEKGTVSVHAIDVSTELESVLQGQELERPHTTLDNGRRVLPDALNAVDRVEANNATVRFDSVATTRIGIVTGANGHFIKTANELESLGMPEAARTQIVARTNWLRGLDFTNVDHQKVADAGKSTFLVRPSPALESHPAVLRWRQDGETAGVHEQYKCEIRDPWFRVDLPACPDAFVTSTRVGPPLLVLNRTNCRCTNALNAVSMVLPVGFSAECAALGFLTTFVALWAELNGRRYGGGALKLDLGTLGGLPLPLVPGCEAAFLEADQALRNGNEEEARQIADRVVLEQGLGISQKEIGRMRRAHQDLVRQRTPTAKKS